MDRYLKKKELGAWGEKRALEYLDKLHYQIIEKNYRTRMGEIDIIARKDNMLVFIEVKTRRNNRFGPPTAAVNYQKQQKIRKLASYYLMQSELLKTQVRFDVITVTVDQTEKSDLFSYSINHYKNAF